MPREGDPPGALAAAATERLSKIRRLVEMIRAETPPGHTAHTHAGLALVGLDALLPDRAATRDVQVLTLHVACAHGDVLHLLHAELDQLALAGDVVDWLWDGERTVTVPTPYVPGVAFDAFTQGAPDAKEAGDEC